MQAREQRQGLAFHPADYVGSNDRGLGTAPFGGQVHLALRQIAITGREAA